MNKHNTKADNAGYEWLRNNYVINAGPAKKSGTSTEDDKRLKRAQDLHDEIQRRKSEELDPLEYEYE